MIFNKARDIQTRIKQILSRVEMPHVKVPQVACIRSFGSKSRARARIWAFPSIWQEALGLKPSYVIEVLAEKFDRLPFDEQTKVLIHELLHIPKTFSGALRPHRTGSFHLGREINRFYQQYQNSSKKGYSFKVSR